MMSSEFDNKIHKLAERCLIGIHNKQFTSVEQGVLSCCIKILY